MEVVITVVANRIIVKLISLSKISILAKAHT
nr:MAG TPA: hypothetical protein [Caudoviricetes sp.]